MSSRRCESLCFIIMCSKFLQPQWWRAPVTSAGLRHCSVSSAAVALHIREAGAILYLQGFSYNIKEKEDRRQKSTKQIMCSWHIQKYGQKCCKCSVMVQKNCEVVRRWDGISVSLNIWQAASRCTLCTALLWMKRAQTWRQGWLWQIPCRVHQFWKWCFRKAALMAPPLRQHFQVETKILHHAYPTQNSVLVIGHYFKEKTTLPTISGYFIVLKTLRKYQCPIWGALLCCNPSGHGGWRWA